MANAEVSSSVGGEDPVSLPSPILESPTRKDGRAEKAESRGQLIEKKIDFLESLAGKCCCPSVESGLCCFLNIRYSKSHFYMMTAQVSNRRSRRWINDRLLMELVPRLNAEEIRGLFAPPPWGDYTPPSPFAMTNCPEWEAFRNINMDAEARIIKALGNSIHKRKGHTSVDKVITLNAWHRVGCRTRQVLRQNFLSDILLGYEDCIRDFIHGSEDEGVMVLHVQDPFRRLLLHGVCEFYDLISVTETIFEGSTMSKVMRIRKRKTGLQQIPPRITLVGFLKMAKDGVM